MGTKNNNIRLVKVDTDNFDSLTHLSVAEEQKKYLVENVYDDMGFRGGSMTLRQFYEDAYPEKARKSRNTEEVEAESVSFAVCAYYGIATGENSFGYIASWSKDKELNELKASLETINKASSELITDIDRKSKRILLLSTSETRRFPISDARKPEP